MFHHFYVAVLFFLLAPVTSPPAFAAWSDSVTDSKATEAAATEPTVSDVSNWPAFLGRGATSPDPVRVPVAWSPDENIAWHARLTGAGQSSPVVWGDRVFVTSIEGAMKDECIVTAISLADGSVQWTHQSPSSQPVRSNYYQSRAAPTPVVDANRVYVFFETGNVVALSHDGEEIWSRSLVDDFGEFKIRIGLSSSLAQTDSHVFVLVDHEGPSYLLAIDKATGKDAWKTDRFSRQSYSSPIVLSVAGTPQVVCSSAGSVDGYDPETGEMLWTYEEVGGNRSTTPLPVSGTRFLIAASPGMHDEFEADARKSNFVMEVERDGDSFTPKVVWRNSRAMPSFASPMVHQGLAYWVTKIGIVFCFDAETGERIYSERLGQSCWATPIGIGDRVYFFGKDGTTVVIKSGREFEVLHKNELMVSATERGKSGHGKSDVGRREKRDKQVGDAEETDGAMEDPGMRQANLEKQANVKEEADDKEADDKEADGEPRRGRDGLLFAVDVQYGYAVVDDSIVIRTGSQLFCIRQDDLATAAVEGENE